MNSFDKREFLGICQKYKAEPYMEEVLLNYENESFFNKMRKGVQTDRRGEVVFAVLRPSGKIITATCSIYPEGIYRIPTGGIGYGEDITEAVFREVKEELGLEVEVLRFGGVQKIKFQHDSNSFMFYSYLFILKEIGGRLLTDAEDDEISEVAEVDLACLREMVEKLRSIKGCWNDWGRFRYITSKRVLDYMAANINTLV